MSELYGMLPDEWTHKQLCQVKARLESIGYNDWVIGVAEDLAGDGMNADDARDEAERQWNEIMSY